jgi:CRISPR/Cas system endoribonuclease Cas6 (RAMP superfamily)
MQTIQQAAAQLLKETSRPMRSREIVQLALERNMVKMGSSKDPVHSLSQALERNIRMNTGNNPKLEFLFVKGVRYIALPESNQNEKQETLEPIVVEQGQTITLQIPNSIINKVKMHQLADHLSLEETLLNLIKRGLASSSSELLEKLRKELEDV